MYKPLSKDLRRQINRRANQLSQEAFTQYRDTMLREAQVQVSQGMLVDVDELPYQKPEVSNRQLPNLPGQILASCA